MVRQWTFRKSTTCVGNVSPRSQQLDTIQCELGVFNFVGLSCKWYKMFRTNCLHFRGVASNFLFSFLNSVFFDDMDMMVRANLTLFSLFLALFHVWRVSEDSFFDLTCQCVEYLLTIYNIPWFCAFSGPSVFYICIIACLAIQLCIWLVMLYAIPFFRFHLLSSIWDFFGLSLTIYIDACF